MPGPQPIPLHAAKCPHCRAVNDVAAAACVQCGAKLSRRGPAGLAPLWSDSQPVADESAPRPTATATATATDGAANHPSAPESAPPPDAAAVPATAAASPFDVTIRPDGSVAIRYAPGFDESALAVRPPAGTALPVMQETVPTTALTVAGAPAGDLAPALHSTHPVAAAGLRTRVASPRDLGWAFAGGVVVATVLIITGARFYRPHVEGAAIAQPGNAAVRPTEASTVSLDRLAPPSAGVRVAPAALEPPPAPDNMLPAAPARSTGESEAETPVAAHPAATEPVLKTPAAVVPVDEASKPGRPAHPSMDSRSAAAAVVPEGPPASPPPRTNLGAALPATAKAAPPAAPSTSPTASPTKCEPPMAALGLCTPSTSSEP